MSDVVNKPAHYQADNFECIDVIKHCLSAAEYQGYLKGCIIKYLYRHNYKGNPEQDLQKAYWYLSRVLGVELHFDEVDKAPTSGKSAESQNCGCAECTWLRERDQ